MKSKEARTKQTFLRNAFHTEDTKYNIPLVIRQKIDWGNIIPVRFDYPEQAKRPLSECTCHFFLDDYKFTGVWRQPEKNLEKLSRFKYVISPDFSLYSDLPISLQIYNVFRRRWCDAFWQERGITIIPAIAWADERSYDFCFNGILPDAIVCVSAYATSGSGEAFINGFKEMVKRINPAKVIVYDKQHPEIDSLADVVRIPANRVRKQKTYPPPGQFELFE